jgi:hypothetical protein
MPAHLDLPMALTAPPPYRHEGCVLQGFLVAGDPEKMQVLIDTTLNRLTDSGPKFNVVGSAILVTALHVDKAGSEAPGWPKRFAPESDIALWLTVKREGEAAISWFPVFMFVFGPVPMLVGREVCGYPKQLAKITRVDAADPLDFAQTVEAETFVAGSDMVVFLTLLQIGPAPAPAPAAFDHRPESLDALSTELADAILGPSLALGEERQLLPPFFKPSMPSVLIRQYRSGAANANTIYQQLVQVVPEVVTDGPSGQPRVRRGPAVELKSRTTGFHQFLPILGLAPIASAKLPFVVEFDFLVREVKVI